jgi:hypothetical protein
VYTSLAHRLRFLLVLAGVVVLIFGCVYPTAHAQTSKKTTTAKPSAPAKPAAKSSTSTTSHGATTASHGPTTAGASHGPTTGNPGGARTTTTGARPMTTAGGGRPAGTAGGSGHPAPAGSHEVRTANGSTVRTRANGTRSDIHDASRGMDIHHGLNGNRRVSVERADHTRIVSERGGRGYVQHPYMYRGHEFGHRTYYYHGRAYDRYYGRYYYHGYYMDVYAPGYYYGPGFYGWAYNPWATPIVYGWGWAGNPWYGYYGVWFTPYPVYASASLWLTDYLIANSLEAAYQAQADAAAANAAALQSSAPLTPETKALISAEVQRQIALENSEAQQNAQNQDVDYGSSGIARMLSDNQAHVFVAGSDLDLVDTANQECAISQGDVLEVTSAPPPDASAATAMVLASKGGQECAKSDNVSVQFADLQDMQNHMRETIDQGMGDLQKNQGQGGLPAAPPSAQAAPVQSNYAAIAPPPDPNAASEIQQQSQQADQAEQEDASAVPPAQAGANVAPAAAPAAPATIALGQTVDQVTAALGTPKQIVNLGTKQIYIYQDMKITFKAGKVSDVE